MKRDYYKTVTEKDGFDILIPAARGEAAGEATFGKELGAPKLVREFTKADRQRAVRGMGGTEGKRFDALLALRSALESRDALQLDAARNLLEQFYRMREDANPREALKDPDIEREYLELLSQWSGLAQEEAVKHFEGFRPGRKAKSDPYRLFSYEVSESVGLLETSLVLWWDGEEFRPAIYCKNHFVALYVYTFFLGRTRYRICPKCGERFEQTRSNQDYCTVAHREAHRVARWRAKQGHSIPGKE